MKVQDLISLMEQKALGEAFQKAIFAFYQSEEPIGKDDAIEEEFSTAKCRFKQVLSEKQRDTIEEMESLFSENRSYAASYGFKCGLYGAFKQYFINADAMDGGFSKLLCDGLFMENGMRRHPAFYERSNQYRTMEDMLASELEENDHDHLTSFVCAWQERVYNAAVQGFYCGYRAAYSIIDSIDPLGRMENIGKILTMEYALGFIHPYSDVERFREMNQQ